ncbi:methylenetetrahydrofolate reductase [NAD(P)H] [Acetanaerobacterium elongatum]|uniref:Methylenetetrahydrofolate reductase n=1 Tax=Acetanaerobacterium elongatum TaxID=258515 RepID=A0A1G9WXG7_9FIRM|nr:methylenetetrahydrofolate reductase [NAD(P)H] [Acetanaerobacterium elongatum]SDM89157.1 5,10-methylenetetrahydrofolate reductase (NAD(P)) [Acetanaerobacterium elongatum]
MKLCKLFDEKKVVFSFEIFPPKKTSSIETVYNTLDALKGLHPDYISVTYGAGGAGSGKTCEIATLIKGKYHIEPLAHLTCINATREQILAELEAFKKSGIENILALRGDRNPEIPACYDFAYAGELVEFIAQHGDYNIVGACYPEGHPECNSLEEDITHLKDKVDKGVSHLNSQLFFDNNDFYRFLELTQKAGIFVPIQAGIMPVTNSRQIERMVSLTGAKLPSKFSKIMARYGDNPEALRDAGIAYATEQIVDLIASGVRGIHLYTMNLPYVAQRISTNISSILQTSNQ